MWKILRLYLTLLLILMSQKSIWSFQKMNIKRDKTKEPDRLKHNQNEEQKEPDNFTSTIIIDCCFNSLLWLFVVHCEMIIFKKITCILAQNCDQLLVEIIFFSQTIWKKTDLFERSSIQRINNTKIIICVIVNREKRRGFLTISKIIVCFLLFLFNNLFEIMK